MELSGARVLLTGASGGIGNAIARELHSRGASLVVTGRRAEVLEELASELPGTEVLVADLADRSVVASLPARAERVDVLVANAALPGSGNIDTYSVEEIDRALDVNLRANVILAHALLPAMQERGSGHLVFISSISGKVAAGGGSIYSATKFGLRGFGMALHDELHGTGVGVTTVFPGFISEAGMFAESDVDLPFGVGTKKPGDVAAAVVHGIEKNRAEIDVAPLTVRFGGAFAGAAPALIAALNRRMGAGDVAAGLAEAQRSKR